MCDLSGGIRHGAALAALSLLALAHPACAQAIMVTPVNVQVGPSQKATVLTVVNQGDRETSFQIRAFAWQQNQSGDEELTATDDLLASPPLATIAPGATQIVRLVLRHPPQAREATYRIFFDQLTPPGDAGRVRVALRLSIPVFAEPSDRVTPDVRWRIANQDGRFWLVAVNNGSRHETIRDMSLSGPDGSGLKVIVKSPPHILAGGLQRWPIETNGPLPPAGATMRLTARADNGEIDQQVGR
jgi:fimbrial chaperone protein